MSLTRAQQLATSDELHENFRRAGLEEAEICHALDFSPSDLQHTLSVVDAPSPAHVWMLRDYLDERIRAAGDTPAAYTIGDRNIYFPYQKPAHWYDGWR